MGREGHTVMGPARLAQSNAAGDSQRTVHIYRGGWGLRSFQALLPCKGPAGPVSFGAVRAHVVAGTLQ